MKWLVKIYSFAAEYPSTQFEIAMLNIVELSITGELADPSLQLYVNRPPESHITHLNLCNTVTLGVVHSLL